MAQNKKYLLIMVGNQHYVWEVSRVREINRLTEISAIPGMPPGMEGLISLRGSSLPVYDLRKILIGEKTTNGRDTCYVVLESGTLGTIGIIVDKVFSVLEIADDKIEPRPVTWSASDRVDVITGLVRLDQKMVLLLNIDQVLNQFRGAA